MPLPLGTYEVSITDNAIRGIGGKSAVSLSVRTDKGEHGEVLIFLTEKSMNIARAQLKRCGFDVDTRELDELSQDSGGEAVLAGVRIPVKVEMYNGKPSAKVDLSGPPPKSEMQRLTAALRASKSRKEGPSFADDAPPPGDDDMPY